MATEETQIFPCNQVNFTCPDFQAGYLPTDTQVILTGLLSIEASNDWPLNQFSFDVESHCGELRFPDGNGVYNQPTYSVQIIPGQTTYIPFALTLTECGKNECRVSYEFDYDFEETTITCTGETRVHSYNATCEWQECLVGTSRETITPVYCNPETDCSPDLCNNPGLQKLAVLVGIDQTLAYKIEQQQWAQVDELFKRGLGLCECTAKPNPCDDCGPDDTSDKCKDRENIVNSHGE